MAKISLIKLGLIKNQEVTEIEHNEQKIEVKKYLPVNEKLELISEIINNSYDPNNNFANPVKVTIFMAIGIIEKYTNINLTDKQKEDPAGLYDKLICSDLFNEVKYAIPRDELGFLTTAVWDCIDAFYKYRNSALGIMETIGQDYSNLDLDATKIQKKMADPNVLPLLKDVVNKLG